MRLLNEPGHRAVGQLWVFHGRAVWARLFFAGNRGLIRDRMFDSSVRRSKQGARFSHQIRARTKRCTSAPLEHWDARCYRVHAHRHLSSLRGGARAVAVAGTAAASAANAAHSSAVRRLYNRSSPVLHAGHCAAARTRSDSAAVMRTRSPSSNCSRRSSVRTPLAGGFFYGLVGRTVAP